MYETTWEWEPLPGQRYPGDPGRPRRTVDRPRPEARPAENGTDAAAQSRGIGRATVGRPAQAPPVPRARPGGYAALAMP
ncbi:MAG TPA: hypothetical protein VFO77_06345, partial [Actinoplanes sp.]|nr:hypothetical protein [Actinoplanes sp.]